MSCPKDIYDSVHFDMVRAHQNFTIGFDNIVKHLQNPPLDDMGNFCGYMKAWATAILHHHDTEEATVFPVLNTKLSFAKEQEQHKILHDFLSKFNELVSVYESGQQSFDAAALLELMEASKDDFFGHLKEELVDIQPQKLRDAGFGAAELKKMSDDMTAFAQKTGDPFVVVPFMFSHTPPEHKYWPDVPWVLKKVMVPYMLALRHYGYWKYAPYAMS